MRTIAYGGVMSARAMKEREETEKPKPITNAAAQRVDPVLSEIVEWA